MRFSHLLLALASVASCVSAFVADRSSDVHPLPFTPFIPTHFETYPSDIHPASNHYVATHPRARLANIATQRHGSVEQTGRDYIITHQHDDESTDQTHVYATQVHPIDGLLIANAHMHVSTRTSTGEVIAHSYNFVEFNDATANKMWSDHVDTDMLTPQQAVDVLAAFTGYDITMEQVAIIDNQYIQTSTNTIVPVYRINVRLQPDIDHWYDAHVSIHATYADENMGVISLVDWVANAAYNVVPLGGYDPQHTGFSLVTNPQELSASSLGWHNDQSKSYLTTQGNNVLAKYMPKSGAATFANGGATLVFNFPFNSSAAPAGNRDLAITNLFYWNNVIHDVAYLYGFTEAAGNFQQYNFGKGGKQLDPVIASADDPSGTNNANFATPPDGQSGTMRMYIFTETVPNRDGDFANDVITHEFMHGISNRLVGGASNVNCLGSGEAGGMGEGWGDFLALVMTRFNAGHTFNTSYGVGGWLINGTTIRKYMYSTNLVTNPTTYGYLQQSAWKEVHAIGEIWCNILYEVYWSLETRMNHYNPNLYSADITASNTLVLAIVMNSFKLMPCSPTFVSARDSMIAAEKALTGGLYKCDLWYAFAKRGLGQGAVSGNGGKTYTQSFQLPTGC